MITRKDAESLTPGDVLYHNTSGSDRRPRRVRVNGKPQLWKTRPQDFRIPAKHGLYETFQITPANARDFHLTEEEAVATLQLANQVKNPNHADLVRKRKEDQCRRARNRLDSALAPRIELIFERAMQEYDARMEDILTTLRLQRCKLNERIAIATLPNRNG